MSTSTCPATDRKRKLMSNVETSEFENDNLPNYGQKLKQNAEKISKIPKTKKVDTVVSAFFQQGHNDGLSDFESPNKRMTIKTPPVIRKRKTTKKRKQPDIRKAIKNQNAMETEVFEKVLIHHSSVNGVSSDELQMAIALSRSLSETNGFPNEPSNCFVIQETECLSKEDVVRNTIQKFGFKKRGNNGKFDLRQHNILLLLPSFRL